MRIGMPDVGSDGDIRPILALGGCLVRRGHSVSIAVASIDGKRYDALCANLGVAYTCVPVESRIPVSQMLTRVHRNASELRKLRMLLEDFFFPSLGAMAAAAEPLIESSDLLVGQMLAWPLHAGALRRRKPYASVVFWPGLVPDRRRPPDGLPDLGAPINRALWKLAQIAFDHAAASRLGPFWDEYQLPRRPALPDTLLSQTLNLIAASPTLYPELGDWDQHRFCGPFTMPAAAEAELPAELRAFLADGEAPAFLGLGSSGQIDAEASEAFLVQVAEKLGRRCVVQLAPGRPLPAVASDRIHFVHLVAHDRLFPRCAVALHHGGAGTTHAVLAAGKPAVVVSFMTEQTAWGRQLVRAGAGGGVFRYGKVSAERVAAALRSTMESEALRTGAERLAAEMGREGGVEKAAGYLEELVG